MSKPPGWEVRISPDIDETLLGVARGRASSELIADFRGAMDLLARNGTRANGAKKLRSLDLWEIRVGDHRAYFCPVSGATVLAVGVLEAKNTKRLPSRKLKTIERKVHRWRDTVEEKS